jgi:hypothetical protein
MRVRVVVDVFGEGYDTIASREVEYKYVDGPQEIRCHAFGAAQTVQEFFASVADQLGAPQAEGTEDAASE